MLLQTLPRLRERAERLAHALCERGVERVTVVETTALVGGGSLPELELPSAVVRIEPASAAHLLQARLRTGDPALLVRVQKGALLLDPRTLLGDEAFAEVADLVGACVEPSGRVG